MPTMPLPMITTAMLKQNPAAAVQRVLTDGTHIVTAHGKPTGAVLAPEHEGPSRWVKGGMLVELFNNQQSLTPEDRHAWLEDIGSGQPANDFITDPWESQ